MELNDLKKYIDLEEFITFNGYTKDSKKSSRKHAIYSNGNEKLIVQEGNDCKAYYVLGTDEKGTIIDFLINRSELLQDFPSHHVFESIKKCLNNYIGIRPDVSQEYSRTGNVTYTFDPTTFSIPKEKDIDTRVFSYLKLRGISQATLNSSVFENVGVTAVKLANSDIINNVAFPLFNKEGEIKAIDYRYATSKSQGKYFTRGSQKESSIGISSNENSDIKVLILTESPIDAMSHYQLYREGKENIQYLFFDGSLSKAQIELFLDHKEKLSNPSIILGFDNDVDGKLTGQAYTTSLLCSMMANQPILLSYAENNQFSFVFTENIPENKQLFKEVLNSIEKVEFLEKEKSFSFHFPKDKATINSINKALLYISNKVSIETSITKDWNDDLKMKQQSSLTKQAGKSLKKRI